MSIHDLIINTLVKVSKIYIKFVNFTVLYICCLVITKKRKEERDHYDKRTIIKKA